MTSFKKIDREQVQYLIKIITTSIDLQSKSTQVTIRRGVFSELDILKERYDSLDALMGEKLVTLSEDIRLMPKFMRKVRMMMIPSVGYFTVVSKCDPLYLEFLNQSIMLNPDLKKINVAD
jgi:hypothetical protein